MHASSPPLPVLTDDIARLLYGVRSAQNEESSREPPDLSSKSPLIKGIEIIHIRFLGDQSHQSATWTDRNRNLNRGDFCISGTDVDGANYIEPIKPQSNERVFEKPCVFDSFMVPAFDQYLKDKRFQHLKLAGLYGDVCIDATARSGFQKGYRISVVQGCVGTLHLRLTDWQNYARKVYGARMVSLDDMSLFEGRNERIRPNLNKIKAQLA